MELRWINVIVVLVVVALATTGHCILDESTQPKQMVLQTIATKEESLASGEEEITEPSTTEVPEPLPTPVAVKLNKLEPVTKQSSTDNKSSVSRKRVLPMKSSVVPKKEVHFIPSVVGKKGADPESSTPSVSARKGVEPYQADHPVQSLSSLIASSENMNHTNVSPLPTVVSNKNVVTIKKVSPAKAKNEKEHEEDSDKFPIPQLVQNVQSNDTVKNISHPLSNSVSKLSSVMTSKSNSVSSINHLKPATADDADVAKSQVSYAPIFMIVALVLLVVVVLAVAYYKLKDIWIRRHYDYVDFLIDGMYE